MQENDDDLIKKEIKENYAAIAKLKKLIPLGVFTTTAFSFLYPLIPKRRSQETLADWMGYPYSVLAMLILSGLIYFYGYRTAVKKRKNEIIKLELKLGPGKKDLDNSNK